MSLIGSRYSVFPVGSNWSFHDIVEAASASERAGFSAFFQQDNIMGHSPTPRDAAIHDPWVLLPALAQATSTIHLGTMVTPVLRRYAPLLAKAAASFDDISGGRLALGLGAGDDTAQYAAYGQPFYPAADRIALLGEAIDVIDRLWSGDPVDHDGAWYQLAGAICRPRPVQQPRPPILLGVNTSKRLLPVLAAEAADGMVCMWGDDERAVLQLETYRHRCAELGRDADRTLLARKVTVLFSPATDTEDLDLLAMIADITGIDYDTSKYGSEGVVPDGVYPDVFIVGAPELAAAEIHRRTFALGFNHVVFDFGVHGYPVSDRGLCPWADSFLSGLDMFETQVRAALEALVDPT